MTTTQLSQWSRGEAVSDLLHPDYLVCEMMDGEPLYYRDFQQVLDQTKTVEEIMGCSSLQAIIIAYFFKLLVRQLDDEHYDVLTNEVGLHINKGNNLSLDLAVFDKSVLKRTMISDKFATVPPKIVVEVDVKVEKLGSLGVFSYPSYITDKVQKLLDFGVEKVIWVVTGNTPKIYIAEQQGDWRIVDILGERTLMAGIKYDLGAYLQAEGIHNFRGGAK